MSKPKYNIGELVVYDSPTSGKNLVQITGMFKSIRIPLRDEGKFRVGQYYDGRVLEISPTDSKDIPLAPKFVTGVTTIPEKNLSPLESLYQQDI